MLFPYYKLFFFCLSRHIVLFFFFFNDTATTEIYTLSLHDALPICFSDLTELLTEARPDVVHITTPPERDRKSTRLNSSHLVISYAVFCLKKKKNYQPRPQLRTQPRPQRI